LDFNSDDFTCYHNHYKKSDVEVRKVGETSNRSTVGIEVEMAVTGTSCPARPLNKSKPNNISFTIRLTLTE